MRKIRTLAIMGACLSVAAASGYVMQNSDSLGQRPDLSRVATAPKQPVAPPELIASGALVEIIPVAQIADAPLRMASADTDLPLVPLRDVSESSDLAGLALVPDPAPETGFASLSTEAPAPDGGAALAPDCAAPGLSLAPGPEGLMMATLSAPCRPGTVVHLQHGALGFDIRTDETGAWTGLVPTLAGQSEWRARLQSGETVQAALHSDMATTVNRVILAWSGPDVLRLNAFEYGAAPGTAGHISSEAPRTPDTQLGGYILVLGEVENGAFAEVYTAPAGMQDISFEMEALLTEASCGQDLRANLVRVLGAASPEVTPISLAMPECDAPEGALLMSLPDLPIELAGLR
ncbi:MAG: hypothetical protein R3D78_13555 [Paracoccaceae bacterium]|jgi:hypothetical protein